ncbi:MAG: hemerythrin domain-containing protein [Thermodesulfobacteriota bacterium]
MTVFAWKPEYALGVDEMDRQHREIFVLLAKLEESLAGEGEGTNLRALAAVRQHALHHFCAEESLLEGVRYPNLVQQRVQHRRFVERLRQAEASASEDRLSLEEVHGLQSWILGHVVGLDREYLPFVTGAAGKASGEAK